MNWKRPNYTRSADAPPAPPITGLGDAVEIIAKPIAKALDRALGTQIQNCAGCAARRAFLNQKFPIPGRADVSSASSSSSSH